MSETKISIRGIVDERAAQQLERCAKYGNAPRAAICADGHVGYNQPIGAECTERDCEEY